ncbi:MAG: hypothetical protein RR324_04535 [Cellulosilyticaceae bacterium]
MFNNNYTWLIIIAAFILLCGSDNNIIDSISNIFGGNSCNTSCGGMDWTWIIVIAAGLYFAKSQCLI